MTFGLGSPTITFEAALRDLASKSPRVRALAAHALGDVVAPAERAQAVAALVEVLGDERSEVRAEAAMSLGVLETEAAVAPLVARLGDDVPVVRQAAAIALGRLGFASAFDAMAGALAEGPPDLRFQAATSLAEIDAERAAGPLVRALEDGDGEVVAAAALALGAIGARDAAEPVARRLADWTRPETRFDLAYALADLGDERSIDVLAGFLADGASGSRELGWDAIEGLERCGHPRAIAPLATLLEQRRAAPRLKLRAAAAVIALAASAAAARHDAAVALARATLLGGLALRKLELRGLAVQLLGRIGGPWAREPLEALRAHRRGRPLAEEIDDALARVSRPDACPADHQGHQHLGRGSEPAEEPAAP